MVKTGNIQTQDAVTLKAEIYGDNNQTAVIINPAIGVKRRMYRAFAEFMVEHGITTVLYNYRGMEDGLADLPNNVQLDAEAWGRLDQTAVLGWAKAELKAKQLIVVGHSIGGQLLGFAENPEDVDGLIHITAQKGDYRLWSFPGRLKLMLLWHGLIPWMSRGETFNASKLGLGSYPWSAVAAKQWSSWGREKDYLFNPKFGFNLTPWQKFDRPMLSYGFTDDFMAPEAAIDGLLEEFTAAQNLGLIDKRIIDPKSLGIESIGHFGFFKPNAKALWQDTVAWIKQQN